MGCAAKIEFIPIAANAVICAQIISVKQQRTHMLSMHSWNEQLGGLRSFWTHLIRVMRGAACWCACQSSRHSDHSSHFQIPLRSRRMNFSLLSLLSSCGAPWPACLPQSNPLLFLLAVFETPSELEIGCGFSSTEWHNCHSRPCRDRLFDAVTSCGGEVWVSRRIACRTRDTALS